MENFSLAQWISIYLGLFFHKNKYAVALKVTFNKVQSSTICKDEKLDRKNTFIHHIHKNENNNLCIAT